MIAMIINFCEIRDKQFSEHMYYTNFWGTLKLFVSFYKI